jgi:GNAT superfamily N-acetyltransferase
MTPDSAMCRKVTSVEEVASVARLAREIWEEHYPPIVGREQVAYMLGRFQSEEAVARQIAEGSEYFLILRGEEGIGYFAVTAEAGASAMFLSKIYVRKSLRGEGFGKAALEYAEGLCRERGLSRLWLTVNKHNSRSIAWYERMGFRNTGAVVKDIGGGFVMDDFRFEKGIAPPATTAQ